ncbi:hypothetical protein [Psychrobacter sp. I-STPA10]|uniref:hypothetical protein n=1 Tax=Psychrobacter sp. I-STPA10 TaxID=2585769 RepID=UPI001E323566|nr:hypothetical protein [Psychrobacter sp. I-STPA10]
MSNNKPWFPNDYLVKEMFLSVTPQDIVIVKNILNCVQTFLPIINPVFILQQKLSVALIYDGLRESMGNNISIESHGESIAWDETIIAGLEKFSKQDFYWTCPSLIEDLAIGRQTYERFSPFGVAKSKMTLANYIKFRSSIVPIINESMIAFSQDKDVVFYQVAGEFILLAGKEKILTEIYGGNYKESWQVLSQVLYKINNANTVQLPIYGNLVDYLKVAYQVYKDAKMI